MQRNGDILSQDTALLECCRGNHEVGLLVTCIQCHLVHPTEQKE